MRPHILLTLLLPVIGTGIACAADDINRTDYTYTHPAADAPQTGGTASGTALTDAMTDTIIRSHRLIYFGDEGAAKAPADSADSMIARFYEDQFRHFQDPLAPYFLFLSKDATLAMGVGGCVRMRAYFDWDNAVPASGFAPFLIPMRPDPLHDKAFGSTPAGTSLFFRVIGQNKKYGDYQLYIQADFSGYSSRDFKLKKAYAILNDWTIGYANSTFSDPSALPPVIDAKGPNCKMSSTNVLVRWMHNLPHGFTVAASIETPETAGTVSPDGSKPRTNYIPDGAAFIQYAWGRSDHVRLAGIVRSLPYRDMKASRNHNVAGWGLQLSTVFHPHRRLTVYGCINGGYGYAGLGGDWQIGGYDLVGDPHHEGRMYAPAAFGGYASLQYNFTPSLFISGTFSASRYCPRSGASPDEYRRGLYVAANIFWNLTARIQVGAEYNLGFRQNVDRRQCRSQRVGALAQFSF